MFGSLYSKYYHLLEMKLKLPIIAFSAVTLTAFGQENWAVKPETNEVLESSVVLDKSTVIQGNKTLKIERLSTPDENLLKSLEQGEAVNEESPIQPLPVIALNQKSYFVSAQTFDHTFTLLNFWSLSGGVPVKESVWSNITSWKEIASSPSFIAGNTQYTMMIFPSSAQVTDESPTLPTALPSSLEGGAYFQEIGEQSLNPEYLSFLENLHIHYELKKDNIVQAHQQKVTEAQQKAAAREQEALQNKTVTLRFWRQEDKPAETGSAQPE